MATSSLPRAASRGGSFLVESCTPDDVFSPAELTDDQKLIGQTAEEFVRNEVVPLAISDLEAAQTRSCCAADPEKGAKKLACSEEACPTNTAAPASTKFPACSWPKNYPPTLPLE